MWPNIIVQLNILTLKLSTLSMKLRAFCVPFVNELPEIDWWIAIQAREDDQNQSTNHFPIAKYSSSESSPPNRWHEYGTSEKIICIFS